MKIVRIGVHHRDLKIKSEFEVEKLSNNTFRMIDNNLVDPKLTLGVEFETIINSDGNHEVIKVLKESEFITKRYSLSPEHTESDYIMLGEELVKRGGFWQVDLSSVATVNIPKDFEYDVDQVIEDLGLKIIEWKED